MHFHPTEGPLRWRAERILKRMCDRFEKSPSEVLLDFHASSGSPVELVESIRLFAAEAQVNLLLSDLKQLNQSNINVVEIAQCPNIAIFHGTENSIVSIEQAMYLHKLVPQSQLFIEPGGTHALPFTHIEQCFEVVCELLNQSQKRKQENGPHRIIRIPEEENISAHPRVQSGLDKNFLPR